jgi:M6 family metalloprotease-like protein
MNAPPLNSGARSQRTQVHQAACFVIMLGWWVSAPLFAQSGLVPLHSWWSTERLDAITTSEPGWIGAPGETRSPDYSFNRAEGFVFDPSLPQPPTTVALYRWFSPLYGDNFLTSNPVWAGGPGDTRLPDYRFSRLEGYAFDRPLAGTVPLNGWWSDPADDNRQTTDPTWPAPSTFPFGRYDFVRTEGYVLPSPNQPPYTPAYFGHGTMKVNGRRAVGSRPLLVILVQYSDFNFRPPHTTNYFRNRIFGNLLSGTRTIAGYFYWNSDFNFWWSEAGVVQVSMPDDPATPAWDESSFAFWSTTNGANNIGKHGRMVLNAAAAAGFNFTGFDTDGNGRVETDELGVLVINASPAGSNCGQTRGHNALTVNGKNLTLNPSFVDEGVGFATIVHEFFHQLGTDHIYGNPRINTRYSSMAATCVDEDFHEYFHADAWHKMRLGWIEPRIISTRAPGSSAYLNAPQHFQAPMEDKRPILLFDPARQGVGGDEYFLLEYRRRTVGAENSHDASVPDDGLLVWWVRTAAGSDEFLNFLKILPGPDGTLQSTVAAGSDDQALDLSNPPNGTRDVIRPGPDFVLQSGVSTNDILASDPALIYYGAPSGTWGTGGPWVAADGQIVLRYYDGSDSGVRLRVGPVVNDGNTISVEWSMDTIPPRLDAVAAPAIACGSTGTVVTVEGNFGVSQRLRRLSIRDGLNLFDLMVSNWTCDRVIARIPAGVPPGNYRLTCYGDPDYSIVGNWLPFRVTPPARLEAALSAGTFRVRVGGDTECRYVLQRSTDLRAWTPVHTNSGNSFYFEPGGSRGARRFYRVVEGP